jgi:16S rRNA (guanine966-N2)-methyltransferase
VAGVRPTSARVREAVFDVLGARIGGCAFLDLYAGTGAVGCEALSRGAARVVLVERNRRAARAASANVALLAGFGAAEILADDARAALRRLAARGDRFGIVFLDPPWDEPLAAELLNAAALLLAPGGVLVLEHRSGRPAPFPDDPGFARGRSYRHGDAALSLLHRAPAGG